MHTLENNIVKSMNLLLIREYGFEQKHECPLIEIAFKVSESKLFSDAFIIQRHFFGYS
jgi:hypothetical protein